MFVFVFFLLPTTLRAAHSTGILVTQGAILRFFAPQGRHIAPIGVKFGKEESTKDRLNIHAKFYPRCRGYWAPKLSLLCSSLPFHFPYLYFPIISQPSLPLLFVLFPFPLFQQSRGDGGKCMLPVLRRLSLPVIVTFTRCMEKLTC